MYPVVEKATVISGSLSGSHEPGSDGCGASRLAGMPAWFERPDVAISIAPRPILFEFMRNDSCLDFKEAWQSFEYVQDGYALMSARDHIEHDVADTDHRYIGRRVPEFFARRLGDTASEA